MEDCTGFHELEYGVFSQWLHNKVGDQHIPITGSIEVTMRCNLRCVHCYIPEIRRGDKPQDELTLLEIQRILDEVTDAGCLWLLLTGGEPFLRPDFLKIFTYAKQKGLITTIFSNGTLITPRIADYLDDWRPFNIEITLYGATQETYERITGIPGSYYRCRRGIDLLLERGLPIELKTMLMTLNQDELKAMKDLSKLLGTHFRFDSIIDFALDSSTRPGQYRLPPDQVVKYDQLDPDRARLWPDKFHKYQNLRADDPHMYLCGAGKQSFHIDSFGNLCLCISARNPSFSLRNGTFRDGWEHFFPVVTGEEYGPDFECLGCALRFLCLQCPGLAEVESGDRKQRVRYLCEVTNIRQNVFGNS